jgi:hypothetical protein
MDWERIWKEMAVSHVEVLSRHFHGEAEEN